ncbi:Uncharacterised protein [Clostridium carnis]|uniref:Uncharacterized protein n=1 Tax=Clostridium carnis TaxID=1530 RepID=A0ABY6SW32_9CLOT|nr:Uncharacterised protein [Clostridium carnis]
MVILLMNLLSAAIYAHFQNSIQAIGPIVIINVFDPSKGTPKTEETSFIMEWQ